MDMIINDLYDMCWDLDSVALSKPAAGEINDIDFFTDGLHPDWHFLFVIAFNKYPMIVFVTTIEHNFSPDLEEELEKYKEIIIDYYEKNR
jgi:hypothetical protein